MLNNIKVKPHLGAQHCVKTLSLNFDFYKIRCPITKMPNTQFVYTVFKNIIKNSLSFV